MSNGSVSIERVGQGTPQLPFTPPSLVACEYGGTGATTMTDAEILAEGAELTENAPIQSVAANFAAASTTDPKYVVPLTNGNSQCFAFIMASANAGAAPNKKACCTFVEVHLAAGNGEDSGGTPLARAAQKVITRKVILDAGASPIAVPAHLVKKYVPIDKQSLYWYYPATITAVAGPGPHNGVSSPGTVPPTERWDYNGAGYMELWPACVESYGSTTRSAEAVIPLTKAV